MALSTLSLCSGYGGLELALELADLDPDVLCYVEREAYASAVLVSRMEEGRLRRAPIWSDITTFDAEEFAGRIDIVVAGYPCKGESDAGDKSGTEHEAWLWPDVWRIVRVVRPRLLFVENVSAHLARSFGVVLGDLSEVGWSAEWDCVPAVAVGAPHERDRVFMLATDPGREPLRLQPRGRGERWSDSVFTRTARAEGNADERRTDADAERARLEGRGDDAGKPEESEPRNDGGPRRRSEHAERTDSDADVTRLHSGAPPWLHGEREPGDDADGLGVRVEGLSRFPWRDVPMPEPSVRRMADGDSDRMVEDDVCLCNRNDQLYVGGNGVVPQAAAAAFSVLYDRLMRDHV